MLTMQPLEHIVLGGQIQKLGDKFLTAVRKYAESIGFRKVMQKVDIRYAGIGDDAEAVGALWNYLDNQINIGAVVNPRL